MFHSISSQFYSLGNVYIADDGNHRIRKVTVATGIINTIAGTGTTTYNGDNMAATSATLFSPDGVALDSAGMSRNYYFLLFFINYTLYRQRLYRGPS